MLMFLIVSPNCKTQVIAWGKGDYNTYADKKKKTEKPDRSVQILCHFCYNEWYKKRLLRYRSQYGQEKSNEHGSEKTESEPGVPLHIPEFYSFKSKNPCIAQDERLCKDLALLCSFY